jgi:hypothetical protein
MREGTWREWFLFGYGGWAILAFIVGLVIAVFLLIFINNLPPIGVLFIAPVLVSGIYLADKIINKKYLRRCESCGEAFYINKELHYSFKLADCPKCKTTSWGERRES